MNTRNEDAALIEIFREVYKGKLFVFVVVVLFSILSVAYSLSLTDKYKSDILLTPSNQANSSKLSSSQLGGLAAMAGFQLGGSEVNKSQLALEILKSRAFITQFIYRHQLKVPLMAVDGWDMMTGKLSYDPDLYDYQSGEWVREVKPPLSSEPSSQEAYEAFKEILTIEEQRDTGFVKVSLVHPSPVISSTWLSMLIQDLNKYMKELDKEEAEKSLAFLEHYLENTLVEAVRLAVYQLIEEQTKTLMLSSIQDEYSFKVIDPPVVSEKKDSPKRALICITGFLLGCILSIFLIVFRYLYLQMRSS